MAERRPDAAGHRPRRALCAILAADIRATPRPADLDGPAGAVAAGLSARLTPELDTLGTPVQRHHAAGARWGWRDTRPARGPDVARWQRRTSRLGGAGDRAPRPTTRAVHRRRPRTGGSPGGVPSAASGIAGRRLAGVFLPVTTGKRGAGRPAQSVLDRGGARGLPPGRSAARASRSGSGAGAAPR